MGLWQLSSIRSALHGATALGGLWLGLFEERWPQGQGGKQMPRGASEGSDWSVPGLCLLTLMRASLIPLLPLSNPLATRLPG